MPIIVCFEGRLAADPELTHTPNTHTAVTEAVVLINRRTKRATPDGQGEQAWTDAEPTRYTVKAWKRRAEQMAGLTKGDSVVVIGHVETESWITTEGDKRYQDTVVVDAIGASLTTPA